MSISDRSFGEIWSDGKRLHSIINFHWLRQFIFLGMNIMLLGLQMPTPFVISSIVNRLANGGAVSGVLPLITLALSLMLGSLIVGAWIRLEATRQALDAAVCLRLHLLCEVMKSHALGLPVQVISELHARFTNDIGAIQNLWPAGRVFVFRHIITIVAAVAALFYIDLILTLTISVFLPIAIICFHYFGIRLSALAEVTQRQNGFSNGVLLESITAAPLAIMSGTDKFHARRLYNSQHSLRNAMICSFRWSIAMDVSLSALPVIISAVIWALGSSDAYKGKHTAGDLVSFALILSILYGPISNLLSLSSAVIVEGVSLRRLLELMQEATGKTTALAYMQAFHQTEKPASIKLDALIYERDGVRLFNDFSVVIAPGNCVALRGANGSGKSTLIELIYGSQPTLASKIFINGIPLSILDIETRHRIFSFLPQDVMVFSDTLRNNIALGRPVTDENIKALCERLGMLDFIHQWPQQLDTWIEEGGRNISGGERQRIGLLRTLVLRTPILLLDEPEQNLDLKTLRCLVAYLKEIKESCTCLLVTHSDVFDEVLNQTIEIKRDMS